MHAPRRHRPQDPRHPAGRRPHHHAELADKVGLSVSPCHRRVKLMEERGVITRYIATVDQKSLGLHVSVFISIKLARQKEEDLNRFARRSRNGTRCWNAI